MKKIKVGNNFKISTALHYIEQAKVSFQLYGRTVTLTGETIKVVKSYELSSDLRDTINEAAREYNQILKEQSICVNT